MAHISIPDAPNVSLMAFYGDRKPPELARLIRAIQTHLGDRLGNRFQPEPFPQIHATLLGCEGLKTASGIVNRWFLERRNEVRYVDLSSFLEFIKRCDRLPMPIQFGGYHPEQNYGFLSRNMHPHRRSFQVRGNFAVLTGWPRRNRTFPNDLEDFRRRAQPFGILHKYHNTPDDIDNDCYMRLGTISDPIDTELTPKIETEIREILRLQPIEIAIDTGNLQWIGYRELPPKPETTAIAPLGDATEERLKSWYPPISG
jgi:hypothetical protein